MTRSPAIDAVIELQQVDLITLDPRTCWHRPGAWSHRLRRCNMPKGIPGRVPCREQDCGRPAVGRGLCRRHYDRQYVRPGVCSVEGCESQPSGHGLCNKHYKRWRTYGDDFLNAQTVSERSTAQWAAWRAERGLPPYPGYSERHRDVRKARGRAADQACVTCRGPAVHWAQTHDTDGTDPFEHYRPMCQNCHWVYDDIGKRSAASSGTEGKSAAAKLAWSRRTPEQRAETGRKIWETRRRNAAERGNA